MVRQREEPRLIDVRQKIRSPFKRGLYGLVGHPLEAFLAIKDINKAYALYSAGFYERSDNFFIDALRYLNVSYEVTDEDLARIPTDGPVLVVANHPLGGIDGIILGAILTSVRSDARILANSLLGYIKEIRPWLIEVNPFGGKDAMKQNIRGMKETINRLRAGHLVGTFPSGTVSHLQLRKRQITDPDWSPNTARFVRMSRATVVPLHFEGKNSAAFQLLGILHPMLRTAMLPREFMRKAESTIRVRVGNPIPFNKLKSFESDEALTDFLRLKTYVLGDRPDTRGRTRHRFPVPIPLKVKATPREEPLAKAQDPEAMAREVEALSESDCIVEQEDFACYIVKRERIPTIMLEIGRLREKTFREVQEGTGRSLDLDQFDDYYEHLFMWDRKNRAIVGAYRLCKADQVIDRHGVKGLYTSTLFKFKPEAIEFFRHGMELGRSFITSEYQKKHASLALIWRAIMRNVARNPGHYILFGPVSITREYQALSKDLMVQFLRNKNFDPELASLIKAKHPPRRAKLKHTERNALKDSVRDIDDVSALISEIELDRKGVPTLLRHYLKLHGQLLSFNIDPDFGQCLDGLIMVDFRRANHRLIKHYMGSEHWELFARYHGLDLD